MVFRTQPAGSGRDWKPLNKVKSKYKVKSKKKVKSNDSGKGNTKEEIKNGNGNRNALNSPEAPAAAPPIVPQLAAEKGGARLIKLPAPSAVFSNCDEAQAIGDIIGGIKHRYSNDCKDFAGDIYEALGLSFDPRSVRGRREIGCFAALWTKAKIAGIDASALEELRVRAIQEAGKIARRRGRCNNVSAVFCTVFKRLLESKVA